MFAVITRVPKDGEFGNLACALGQVFLDPQIKGLPVGTPALPLHEALGNPALGLYVQIPVFRLGELLIMDDNGRDQFGRKPGKWSVTCEHFANIDSAVKRIGELSLTE